MTPDSIDRMPWWAWTFPALAWVMLVASHFASGPLMVAALAAVLIATVFASVHHAEIVALKVGEPFGTLVLAVAVTVIEVALVVSVMLGGGPKQPILARDTVFSAVMIVCNGIVGGCLLLGGVRHHAQGFQIQAASAAIAVLAALTVLTLVLPNFTTSTPGPTYTTSQLVFVGIISLVLYGVFVFVQTVRHRPDFLIPVNESDVAHPVPGNVMALASLGLMLVCLVAVVGLAKSLAPTLENAAGDLGLPKTVVGVAIAALVLLPEGLSALAAAHADRLQTSLNLSLGSALASIGLTIPVVAGVAILLDMPLTLGIEPRDQVLLALTLLVTVVTLGTGRTTVLQGFVHLVILATYLFFAVVP